MPDIDVDFCFERRQEVIDYVRRKYGDDCVVQIVTFGTLAARGVIRDVGRVMDLPYAQVDTIAKMIPQELNITIDKALKMNPELKKRYEEQPENHDLIDTARRLEGQPRHTSLHAAGDEMGDSKTFRGYGPEQGYDFLQKKINENDYIHRGVDLAPDENFISDGAKSDIGNIGDILSMQNRVAVTDPVYPVYIDTNVMGGRAGNIAKDGQHWDNII